MKKRSSPPPRRPAPRNQPPPAGAMAAAATCTIVGLGASAGGLEALAQFLGAVPAASGLAFVVVQHVSPTRKGMLVELLQRATPMEVLEVRDQMPVRPDCVYVIPPNRDMSILHGTLHLFAPALPRGLRLPIDFFFQSLAQDLKERSVGVILSGMGTDGTLGVRAIKQNAGLVLVQDPATAKFDGMPRSVIDAALADIVAAATALPARILTYLQRTPLPASAEGEAADRSRHALEKIIILLRARSGHDFSLYKRNTLDRRIARRMGLHQVSGIAAYVRYLQKNPPELDLLFKELLIGVTTFFRDAAMWSHLGGKALPALLRQRTTGQALRAWVAGCSTGEEAYSLAIVFREAVENARPRENIPLHIFATDLDPEAINRARKGVFPATIAADVSATRLKRFFTKEEAGYRVRNEIREMVTFAPQNLVMDPPFTKLDLLSCRNLMIYLGTDVQKKLIPLFHYSLNPGGILILGSAETIGPDHSLFTPLEGKLRLFQRTGAHSRLEPLHFPASFSPGLLSPATARPAAHPPAPSLQVQADQLILRRFSAPAVLVNHGGDIVYASGSTGEYLEAPAGKANWNLFAMAREDLRPELAGVFQQALRDGKKPVQQEIGAGTAERRRTSVRIQHLDEPGPLYGLLIVLFSAAATEGAPSAAGQLHRAARSKARVAKMEQDLLAAHAEAASAKGEMQSAQEELRSTNEELQSTIEEIQSTNEELTTSKEEIQSMNEELQTLNAELQSKVDEHSRNSDDMKNLLDSTEIATLFLDNELRVRRFTPQTTKIIKLIPGDVGRPVTDLVSDLDYPALTRDVRMVLHTLTLKEKSVAATGGRWYSLRIIPYRTKNDGIEGVVITFANITRAKEVEAKMRRQQASLKKDIEKQSAQLQQRKQGRPR